MLRLNFTSRPSISDSKLGGLPYWDDRQPYPTDEKGMPMALLAQINFSKHRMAKPLPRQGLLQFFISCNQGLYGYNSVEPSEQINFRVVYHPMIDGAITKRHIAQLRLPCLDPISLHGEYALSIKKGTSVIDATTASFNQYLEKAINALFGDTLNGKDWSEYIDDDINRERIYETFFEENKFHLLGFPYFIQNDVHTDYDTLLLQMPSLPDLKDGNSKYAALWGDCGILKFFINKEKLMNCDFSDVMYHFECH